MSNTHELLPTHDNLIRLVEARHTDPHSILGMHFDEKLSSIVVRVFDVEAQDVYILFDGKREQLEQIHEAGLFAIKFPNSKKHFTYQLEKIFDGNSVITEDSYCYMPGIGEMDVYLFNSGEHQRIYETMGAHLKNYDGVEGVLFTVWAPNAERVSVVGDFNNWNGTRNMMRLMGHSGIWELFIPRMSAGDVYKFEIRAMNGDVFCKLDPYALQTELRPNNAAIVSKGTDFTWSDEAWIEKRKTTEWLEAPVNMYEVHLASWQGPGLRSINHDGDDDSDFHNYREIAHALADYVCEMGYTHIELMPVSEHPLDISWGYQVTAYYSPTARHGTPEDFAYFVNHMHERGIGVVMDWVPAHFPKDAFALGRFDGTSLYEHADPKQGEHRDWGTYIFNFGRSEVRNFLIGNALYWIDKFHIDGLRVDAVASMLYLDYSKEEGDWIPNEHGGNENLEAISFMRRLNELSHELFPGSLMIAEESTAFPSVSRPAYLGGLGYTCKWNMGWMHDTLEYFQQDPVHRKYHHGTLTFALLYAHSENFVLPFSHDEVVHGKKSMLGKMPGDYWQQFANLRALYTYMLTHPGKSLLFMGSEFGQWTEWNCQKGLDWNVLEHEAHQKLSNLVKDINHFYKATSSLWEDDFRPEGFQWIDGGDYEQSVISFIRWDKKHENPVVVVLNLTPVVRENYCVGVPAGGKWREAINTDNECYYGSNVLNTGELHAQEGDHHGQPYYLDLNLAPLSGMIYTLD